MTIIEQFLKHGNSASFHYADDSGREWAAARLDEYEAMQLYMDNPDMQEEMEKQASFLWSIQQSKDNWKRTHGQF